MTDIQKTFPGVLALSDVHLAIRGGEVHALMGENGAGKSTLMKILMGLYRPDGGCIRFYGEVVSIDSPSVALRLGISMIHQELSPIPEMTVAENIFLGRESLIPWTPFIKKKEQKERTQELLAEFNLDIDAGAKMSSLSVAQMQMVEIIKAISYDSKLIIMDEPTSALADEEVDNLFATIRDLKRKNVSVIYISHRLEEVFEIADRATVLRDGQYIGTLDKDDITKDRLISMMVGRELSTIYPKQEAEIGPPVLEANGLVREGIFSGITFKVHRGEILGIAGLIGSGRSEIMRALFGLDPLDSGEVYLEGEKISIHSPRDAIRRGIVMVNEDRKGYGLVLCRSIRENIALQNLEHLTSIGLFIRRKNETKSCSSMVERLSVKAPSLAVTVESLSGGNQQKVVLAKSLMIRPRVLILDEPTRGIDVGAKAEIHRLMSEFASEGMAIIMISSELPEVMGMSDRILVVGEGRIRGEFLRDQASQEDILKCALAG
jgi:ABC-type sugar transport system ATPase subunit